MKCITYIILPSITSIGWKYFKTILCHNSITCWTWPRLDQTPSTSPTPPPLFWKSGNSEQNKFANRYITDITGIFCKHFVQHIFQKSCFVFSIVMDVWSSSSFGCLHDYTVYIPIIIHVKHIFKNPEFKALPCTIFPVFCPYHGYLVLISLQWVSPNMD